MPAAVTEAFQATDLARQISSDVKTMPYPCVIDPCDGSTAFLWCYDTGERGSDLETEEAQDWAEECIDKKAQRRQGE